MARKISISFKETKKDIDLYNVINELDDKSAEIKFILREYFKNELREVSVNDNKIESYVEKGPNVLDF